MNRSIAKILSLFDSLDLIYQFLNYHRLAEEAENPPFYGRVDSNVIEAGDEDDSGFRVDTEYRFQHFLAGYLQHFNRSDYDVETSVAKSIYRRNRTQI